MNESALEPDYSDYYQDPDTVTVKNESLPPYSITFYGSSCRFWDEIREMWATDGCEVCDATFTFFFFFFLLKESATLSPSQSVSQRRSWGASQLIIEPVSQSRSQMVMGGEVCQYE